MKPKIVLRIEPDEVMQLAEWWTLENLEIVEALDAAIDTKFRQEHLLQSRLLKLLIVWNAGRVQGIREVWQRGK